MSLSLGILAGRRGRAVLVAILTSSGMAVVVYGAASFARQQALERELARSADQLGLYAEALRARIDRYRLVPALLAQDSLLQDALAAPADSPRRAAASRKLERINASLGSSTLTLIDAQGRGAAASNAGSSSDNVGYDFSFRPYFQQAREHGEGRFYGIGITTGIAGYYLTRALQDSRGVFKGAVAVKLELQPVERAWSRAEELVMVSDENGIVFLTNRDAFRYRSLQALSATQRSALVTSRQYAAEPLAAVRFRGRLPGPIQWQSPPLKDDLLWQSQALPSEGWTLHLLSSTRPVAAAARSAGLAAAGGWLALVFLALLLEQRWRLSALRRRSQRELETLVSQHTEALRTAQDGVVEAARRAALGSGENLEHLPQGLSVIDGDLRLVAWNRRYVEIFRFPAELMQVGRPIEDLLRYNGKRGLLGPGDPEQAIQRRLEHLRSGKPHVHERERPDGTVLEIRGNPLPDGGFVTSYADITAYKQTARELRSLADSLERRVAQRTEDLHAATAAAERANRAKSRFVAAAVHDLLQPLNAARMFLQALRQRPLDDSSSELVSHTDGAMAAQDAILASLLDIARLESGALHTQIRSFSLQPLFEVLQREFAMLASRNGLEFRSVVSTAVVRSDEALLRRLLQNLLSNAIRYTAKGRVLFGARRLPEAIRIEVWDTGPGIPEDKHAEIFEEFRRLDPRQGQEHQGAGLGLAIVDGIARRLGHRITLRSQVGRGSVFSVTVPLGTTELPPPVRDATALDEDRPPLAGRTVWCVDDDPRQREGLSALIQSWGGVAHLLGGVVDLADREDRPEPDLLLLDDQLGASSGIDFHEALRSRGFSPPTILITAQRDAATQALARSRGWGYLPKPVKAGALRALIARFIKPPAG